MTFLVDRHEEDMLILRHSAVQKDDRYNIRCNSN